MQSKQINAFCLPGGKVVFYTGIIPVCENDGGMATVMGHEIGHALARHGSQRMAQKKIVGIIQQSAAVSLSDMDPNQQRQVMAVLGIGAQFGILLPYSREHESEADHLGVLMMAVAGYDPRYSVTFWQRMAKATGGGKTPEFQSTHPSHETRVRQLEDWQEEALQIYKSSQHQQSSRPLPNR
ncbi:MAG: M48 family metallopeptidase [Planctomycetia bacterium]|nr:M48 family metallopeptidase [Planctomycetia bacterium]